ncbi:tetratricopeptide repeat protein [Paenibacillus forsythiae]|uniref:tetratricopeptide repeat protein n=1 Tax=Paenibacillus forsythiae TaxID=365616 RepID=UPI0012EB3889|nr:tetratricopeptide repeat protein [Paenibacillus forsythiae]
MGGGAALGRGGAGAAAGTLDLFERAGGKDREQIVAVPFHEQSLSAGLADERRPGALWGLGNTYRTSGEYEQSEKLLRWQ